MKNYFKGLLSGIIAMMVLFSIPVLAQTIKVVFNEIAININGVDRVSWGKDLTIGNGSSIPYSIMYGDTTYLPMRKIGEFCDKIIYWNGDTKTASMTNPQKENSQQIITEKPDKNGNVWTYYTFTTIDGKTYLGAKDKQRNYERIYRIVSANPMSTTLRLTEDALYFIRSRNTGENNWERMDASIYKISFQNDENSQDGEELRKIHLYSSRVVFDGDYLYYAGEVPGTGAHGVLNAINYITGETTEYNCGRWTFIKNLSLISRNDSNTTLNYDLETTSPTYLCEIVVYKDGALRFGVPKRLKEKSNP